MADYNPQAENSPPGSISLLTILRVINSANNEEFVTQFKNVNDLLSRTITPSFTNITGSPYDNVELGEILMELFKQILVNRNEIIYTKHLIALLTFELIEEQGIDVNDDELQQNMKLYLKIN